ncbi:hypothetical protein OIDMADRAFT_88131, partial [Oidiodendron maius Zn]
VQITRKLGIRFLWIDSLCIIQDDPQDLERESAQMASIYRYLTISIGAFGRYFDPIAEEPLSTRGWTLQERLLSPRTIH